MKKRILIALIVILALSVSVLAGCNLDIMSVELKSGTFATEYFVGDTVDFSKAKLTVVKSDGTTEDVAFTSSMLDKTISTAQAGTTDYTVTYEGFSFTLTIKVKEVSTSVSDFATTYFVGDAVNYSDGKLVITRGENNERITLTQDMFDKPVDTSAAAIGTKEYTVTYESFSAKVSVTVKAPEISVKAETFATTYYVGDVVSFTGAKLTVKGSGTRDVNLTADMLNKAIDTSVAALGKNTYTISYNGATTTCEITVLAPQISIKAGTLKTDYLVGETVSLEGAKITVTAGEKVAEVALTAAMLDKAISTETVGTVKYTVSYNGATVEFNVTVRQVKEIVKVEGLELTPIEGESVELSNAKITVKYSDDTTAQIALTAAMLDKPISTETAGQTTYTITYGGKTLDIVIDVQYVHVKSISVDESFETTYYKGYTEPNFAETKLIVTFDDGSTRNMALSSATFSPAFDKNAVGTTEYTLTFGKGDAAKTTKLSVTVVDYKLVVENTSDISFNVGDNAFNVNDELIGVTIKVLGTDNHVLETAVKVTKSMLGNTVFNTETSGNKEITISYKEKSVNATVKILPVTIRLATAEDFAAGETPVLFATSYRPGAKVDYVGKIVVIYDGGRKVLVDITDTMFGNAKIDTSYSKAGSTVKYTITYLGATAEIDVSVLDFTIELQGVKNIYKVGEEVKYGGKIVLTYSDNTTSEVALTQGHFVTNISTANQGVTVYKVNYQGKTADVTVTVIAFDSIETFELPAFVNSYNAKQSDDYDTSVETNFAVKGNVYEVGNANGFIFNPIVVGFKGADRITTTIAPDVRIEVSDSIDGTYKTLSASEMEDFVTIIGNIYYFEQNANGKFVKLTVSVPEGYALANNSVKTSHTFTFKIIDNGYNVYDQSGLAVMNDYSKPQFWADILGYDVVDGNIVARADALKLEADTKPLCEYLGQVDWLIVHGDITVNPDNLPAQYFWLDANEDQYKTAYNYLKDITIGEGEDAYTRSDLLLGSMRDVDTTAGNWNFLVTKNDWDNNNNKGIYNTNKISISGNYFTIQTKKSETRSFVSVAHRNLYKEERKLEVGNQWHLFNFMPDDPANIADTKFTVKNIGMRGERGNKNDLLCGGVSMLRFYAGEMTVENLVATQFNINMTQDNFNSGDNNDNIINVNNARISDTFNAMAVTYRGEIHVRNSILKNAAGPAFLLSDGDYFDDEHHKTIKHPVLDIDSTSVLETWAMGTEAWYDQLGTINVGGTQVSAARALFMNLNKFNNGCIKTLSGRSFYTPKTVGTQTNEYANLVAAFIPEIGSALSNKDFNNQRFHGTLTYGFADGTKEEYDWASQQILGVANGLATLGKGTVIFKSGNNYAWIIDEEKQLLASVEFLAMFNAHIKTTEGQTGIANAGGNVATYLGYCYQQWVAGAWGNSMTADGLPVQTGGVVNTSYATWTKNWKETSTSMMEITMQGKTGDPTSPYLGVIFRNFDKVAQD